MPHQAQSQKYLKNNSAHHSHTNQPKTQHPADKTNRLSRQEFCRPLSYTAAFAMPLSPRKHQQEHSMPATATLKTVTTTTSLRRWYLTAASACSIALSGCTEQTTANKPQTGSLLKPAAAEISEFRPEDNKTVVDPKIPVTDPLSGPLAVLKNAQRELPALAIEHALNLFNASEGRYPQSFEEFMSRIITENKITLPQLPAGLEYQYDVPNHQLVVVSTAAGENSPPNP
jgi:hypothetical protein